MSELSLLTEHFEAKGRVSVMYENKESLAYFTALHAEFLKEKTFEETYNLVAETWFKIAHEIYNKHAKQIKTPRPNMTCTITLKDFKKYFGNTLTSHMCIVFNFIDRHFDHPEIEELASKARKNTEPMFNSVNDLMLLTQKLYINNPDIFHPYKKAPLPVTEPSIYQNTELAPTPTDPVTRSSTKGLRRPDLWVPDGSGGFLFQETYQKTNQLTFCLNPTEITSLEALLDKTNITLEEVLGKDTATIGCYIASTAKETNQPLEPFYIKGTNMLRDVGWNNRKDMTLTEKLKRLVQRCRIVGSFTIYTPKWHLGKSRQEFRLNEGNMWYIEAEYIYDAEKNTCTEALIKVTPGPWAKYFMDKDSIYQFGYVTKQLMALNTHQNPIASTIWMYLITNQNLNTKRRVIDLLREVFSEEKIQKYLRTRSTRQRLVSYWEETLLLLQERGTNIIFCDRTYPVNLRPTWCLQNSEKDPTDIIEKRPQGYAERILQGMVTLIVPRPEEAKSIKTSPKQKEKKIKEPTLTGEQVKKARRARSWSLRDLAHLADIPYSTIANIERGRKISPKNEKKLLEVFPELSELT